MIKKLFIVVRKVVISICILYAVNLLLSSLNIIIPINLISILVVSLLDFPGLCGIVISYLII